MTDKMEYPDKDIFWSNGSWYFWDADWEDAIGPFDTEGECQENYKLYNEINFGDTDGED